VANDLVAFVVIATVSTSRWPAADRVGVLGLVPAARNLATGTR
jgi:hypothetical protein